MVILLFSSSKTDLYKDEIKREGYLPMQTITLIDNQFVTDAVVQIWFRKKGVFLVTNRTVNKSFLKQGSFAKCSVLPVYQADHDLYHRVHLVSVTLGYHQR